MRTKYFKYFLPAVAVLCLFLMMEPALAQYGLDETAGAAGLQKQGDLATLAGNVIGTALSMIGVLFFILMLYGGFLWMTARGKEDQANKAKETIIAAVIGMIIVLSAYAITNFVFQAVEGQTQFGDAGTTQTQTCQTSVDCAAQEYCSDNQCFTKKESDNDCYLNEHCLSDLCAGGVCA